LVHAFETDKSTGEQLLEEFVPDAFGEQFVVGFIEGQCSRVGSDLQDGLFEFLLVPWLVLLVVDHLAVAEVAEPQLVALGVAIERDLVLFLLGQRDVLKPVLVVEWEIFQKDAQKLQVAVGR
jgi:hypothetical protein